MTATENAPLATVHAGGTGRLYIDVPGHGSAVYLTMAQAEALAGQLERAVHEHAPTMERVVGPLEGDNQDVWSAEQAAVALAEGWEILHGLRCPHCHSVVWNGDENGIYIVDASERWTEVGYRIHDGGSEDVGPAYADSGDRQGLGYRCVNCGGIVTLPDDVEEVWG